MAEYEIKECPQCEGDLKEVRKARLENGSVKQVYPSIFPKERNVVKFYSQYRYYCLRCKKEWLFTTGPGLPNFSDLPDDDEYVFSENEGLLIRKK